MLLLLTWRLLDTYLRIYGLLTARCICAIANCARVRPPSLVTISIFTDLNFASKYCPLKPFYFTSEAAIQTSMLRVR